jgi:ethanolamine-phosphate cytidylyltransferase
MLLCTKTHFIKSLESILFQNGSEPGLESSPEGPEAMLARIKLYATDETAKQPGADVWFWSASTAAKTGHTAEERGTFRDLFRGPGPKPGQRVVYVDGGFDLFSSGHIEFLRLVVKAEEDLARKQGWYEQQAVDERIGKGSDYGPVFVVAGVHDDDVINHWKGVNYPIMNIYERGLCVLQCRVCYLLDQDFMFPLLTETVC